MTRMHSSRMRTVRFSGRLCRGVYLQVWGCLPLGPGWMSASGSRGCLPLGLGRGCLPQPFTTHPLSSNTPFTTTPPPYEQNDWQTGIITLPCPTLRLWVVKIRDVDKLMISLQKCVLRQHNTSEPDFGNAPLALNFKRLAHTKFSCKIYSQLWRHSLTNDSLLLQAIP